MQAVILAAGNGTRMLPLTKKRSKAMMPVLGKPIVERVMDDLRATGVRDFVIVTSPEDQTIRPYFERVSLIDARVRFVEQAQARGMADALRCAVPLIEGDFILAACDSLVPADDIQRLLKRWQAEPRPDALLSLMSVDPEVIPESGIVAVDGEEVLQIIEKPDPAAAPSDIASLPLYIFTPQLLDDLSQVSLSPRGEYELQDAIRAMISRGSRVIGERVSSRMTLTRPSDLLDINRHYLQRTSRIGYGYPASVGHGAWFEPPVFIEQGTRIREGCTIGPNVYIEPDCIIGPRAIVREAVLLAGCRVDAEAQIENQVVA